MKKRMAVPIKHDYYHGHCYNIKGVLDESHVYLYECGHFSVFLMIFERTKTHWVQHKITYILIMYNPFNSPFFINFGITDF